MSMNQTVRMLMAEVLDEGLDDWVVLAHVFHRAATLSGVDMIMARSTALTAIQILLGNDLIVAGNIGDSGFEAWDLSPSQAFDRIMAEGEVRSWVFGLTDVWRLFELGRGPEVDRAASRRCSARQESPTATPSRVAPRLSSKSLYGWPQLIKATKSHA